MAQHCQEPEHLQAQWFESHLHTVLVSFAGLVANYGISNTIVLEIP